MQTDTSINRIRIYIDNTYFYEHQLNALLKYSLKDVFSNDVHHLNHHPLDNDPSNLVVLSHGEHSRLHQIGKTPSDETKQKMSNAKIGHTPWNAGKKCPTMSESKKGNKNPMWKNYPRIISKGLASNGKQRWVIMYHGKQIKSSVDYKKLCEFYEDTFHVTMIT